MEPRPRLRLARRVSREERELRAAFLAEAETMTPYVAVEIGDELFFVRGGDPGVGKRLFVARWRSDMTVIAQATGILAAHGHDVTGTTFVDVGANIGTTTVPALRRHGFGAGVALEPSPDNFEVLRLNLAANDLLGRVRALQVAVSDTPGEFTFDQGPKNTGGHRLAGPRSESTDPPVTTVILDGLGLDPADVGLVWIDAVGHEGKVLRGAPSLLDAGVPVVTAVKIGWHRTVAEIVALLSAHYTHVVELRGDGTPRPAAALGDLVASLERSSDVLAFRA